MLISIFDGSRLLNRGNQSNTLDFINTLLHYDSLDAEAGELGEADLSEGITELSKAGYSIKINL